jgi:hypothetical protein
MLDTDAWCSDQLKAFRVRAYMIEEYGDVGAWLNNFEEYKRRLAAADPPPLEECAAIVDRLKRLVGK